jgi:hypothetical protein
MKIAELIQAILEVTSIIPLWIVHESKLFDTIVRVRWVNHKCKVNSDEFDEGATLYSW